MQQQLDAMVAEAEEQINVILSFAKEHGLNFELKIADKLGTGLGYFDRYEGYYSIECVKEAAEDDSHESDRMVREYGEDYWDGRYVEDRTQPVTRWSGRHPMKWEGNPNKPADYEEKRQALAEKLAAEYLSQWHPESGGGTISYNPQHGLVLNDPWISSSMNC